MAVLADPGREDWVPILKYANIFTKPLELHIQLLSQGILAYVLWNVSDIELALGLVVARCCLTLAVLFEYFLSHLTVVWRRLAESARRRLGTES